MAKKKNIPKAETRPRKADKKEKVTPTVKAGAQTNKKSPQFIVSGHVKQPDGSVAAEVLVHAYDQDLRKKQLLGKAVTDAEGRYKISYSPRKFLRAEKGSADLRVCVVDEKGDELAFAELFSAPAEAVIYLTLPAEPERRSEFELLVNAILPLLKGQGKGGQDLPIAALEEKDFLFLVKETGQPQERITFLAAAAKAALDSGVSSDSKDRTRVSKSEPRGIPVESFYGWFRKGLPTDPDALWSRSVDDLIGALKKSIVQNIIPEKFGQKII